jgi:hypothetical protein
MRYLGIIFMALAIAAVWWYLSSSYHPASHDANDNSTIEYWISHNDERALMISYCARHPEEQNGRSCALALAAQRHLSKEGQQNQTANGAGCQGTSMAKEQLDAQKAANDLP